MNARRTLLVALFFSLSLSVACGAHIYKVAPLPSPPPVISTGDTSGLSLGAVALNGDSSLELFEANLLLARVICIDVRLLNGSAGTINGRKLKFELRDAAGKKYKQLSPKKALDRVMNYYGNSFYRKGAKENTRDDYEAVSLRTDSPISPGDERRGYIFFESKSETTTLGALTLTVKGWDSPLAFQFDINAVSNDN